LARLIERTAFKKRWCFGIADGFYEWQLQGKHKQPMWIGLRSKRPFAFAGLWEHWQPPEGEALEIGAGSQRPSEGGAAVLERLSGRRPIATQRGIGTRRAAFVSRVFRSCSLTWT
jgi:hypothetical protein